MGEVWIAIVAALGASGVAGALVSWWKDRDKDDAEVTKLIRDMSKEAVADAKSDIASIKEDMKEMVELTRDMRSVLRELTDLIERDVIPIIEDHPLTADQLRILAQKASRLT